MHPVALGISAQGDSGRGRRKVELPVEVGELRGRIEGWRLNRARGGRMPEELWGEALDWARIYGACAISRALGIGYASLRIKSAVASATRLAS